MGSLKIKLEVLIFFYKKLGTYIISIFKRTLHSGIHIMLVQGHKECIDNDTQGDKQVSERIEDDK